MVNVNEVLKNKNAWKEEFNKNYDYIKQTIGEPEAFFKSVDVYFPETGEVYNLLIADYIVNLMMWIPSIKLKMDITPNEIFDCEKITSSSIKNYIDNTYVRKYRTKVDSKLLNVELAKVIEHLKMIVEDFGIILGISYSLYDIYSLAKNNERFNDLIHTSIPDKLQSSEIEVFAKSRLNETMDILKNSNTGFRPMLNSGVGFNPAQLQEYLVVIGNKPDLDGKTIPMPINSNVLIGGLSKPSDYTIDAMAGRKAQIMNKEFTGDSGYFSRQLSLLTMDISLNENSDREAHNCGTQQTIKYFIDDYESLRRLEGRYYKLNKNKMYYKSVKYDDYDLIGKYIYLRSPIKCASKNGICKVCYGEQARINKDIHIGIFAATHISSRFTQNILSSKHSLMTNSETLKLNRSFYNLFTMDGNHILPIIENVNGLYMRINKHEIDMDIIDDISELDQDDISIEDFIKIAELIYISRFDIVDENGNVITTIYEKNNNKFLLSRNFIEFIDKNKTGNANYIDIDLYELSVYLEEEQGFIMSIDVLNNELTKTLDLVKGLIEKENHAGSSTIEEMLYKFNRYLIDGKINTQLVHAEIIMRNLIRDSNDILQLPDFSKGGDVDYKILTLKNALMNHPSPIISLSFERINLQLKRVSTYRKHKSSLLDGLFKIKFKETYDVESEEE